MIRAAAVQAALRQALAGAVGGLLAFLMLEPQERAVELQLHSTGTEDTLRSLVTGVLLLGVALGAGVSALLTLSDELSTGRPVRIVRRTLQAGVVGSVIGLLSSIAGQAVYSIFLPFTMFGGMIFQVIGRTLGWALLGVGIGLSGGLVVRSGRRVSQGALGGAIGGAIGGYAFDSLAAWAGGETATLSRLVGFTVLGAAVGLATAIVEQLARTAWVTFLSGSREGQQLVLHSDVTAMGRDELAGIPLFGDPRVSKTQCLLENGSSPRVREVGELALLRVDGVPAREAGLTDGTMLEIGKHRLRFHLRSGQGAAQPASYPAATPAYPASAPVYPGSSPAYSPYGQPMDSGRPAAFMDPIAPELQILRLRVLTGAAAGAVRDLEGQGCSIGRELDNSLSLSDMKVSRHHVRIEPVENGWLLVDLQSRNGTRLNGLPVLRAGLAAGDVVTVGDTEIAVEGGEAGESGRFHR